MLVHGYKDSRSSMLGVAQILHQHGYQVLVGPIRYSTSMADEQMQDISRYIAEVLRIREELKDTIFLGEFLDVLEVSVSAHPNLKYNTHRNPRTGKRACVLVNQGLHPLETSVTFEGDAGAKRLNVRMSLDGLEAGIQQRWMHAVRGLL